MDLCREHVSTTMDVPERYRRNTSMLGRFPVVDMGKLASKGRDTTDLFRGSFLPTFPSPLRRIECRWNLYRLSNLAWQYPIDNGIDDTTTRILVYSTSDQRWHRERVGQLRPQEKSKRFFEACLFNRAKPRHQPEIQRWEAGGLGYRN